MLLLRLLVLVLQCILPCEALTIPSMSNQDQYTGQIQDGRMNERGKLVYPNQEVYEVSILLLFWRSPNPKLLFVL